MGFLIFAFRKLTLKRQINQKQFTQMTLANQQQRVQEQISIMEKTKSAMQDAWSTTSNATLSTAQSLYNLSTMASQSKIQDLYKKYGNANTNDQVSIMNEITEQQEKVRAKNTAAYAAYQAVASGVTLANYAVNSVFSAADDAQLQALHRQDQRYEEEQASLDSQLKLLNAEYESVTKAESDAAKQSAPSFGL